MRGIAINRLQNVFSAKAEKDYGVGEEVFISYGPKSNEGLWETYGFLLDENPYNCVEFSVNLDNGNNLFCCSASRVCLFLLLTATCSSKPALPSLFEASRAEVWK